ncbi:hypothetical protein BH10PSE1_BH10PSE1_10010 [soil metagenome]
MGLDYTNPNLIRLTDPRGWGGTPGAVGSVIQAGYLGTPNVTDELKAIRLAAHGDIDQAWISSVDFGVNANTREKDFFQGEFFLTPANGRTEQPIPTACLQSPTTIGYLGFSMISYDTQCVLDSGVYTPVANATSEQIARSWNVKEEINTYFFQANLDGDLGWLGITGNIGFQIQQVEQTGSGFAAGQSPTAGAPALLTPISETEDYTEFLPSMNLIFHVTDSDVVRFAAARTLARPRLDQLRGSQTVTFNSTQLNAVPPEASYFGGSGGNPHLKPWDAYVYDVSYEHYFAPGAYVSIAGFYKDLQTFIYNQTELRDYTGYASPAVPASYAGLYTSPQNGTGGSIQGIELAASIPFGVFFEPLDGFGLVASYSDTSSDIQPDPGNPSRPLEGLSEEVSNLTVYYEKYGFQARVSNRTRSAFLGEIAGFGNARDYRSIGDESLIDAQIGYEFQSGPLEGLSVLVQGNNLTNEEFRTISDGIERRAIDYQVYGRTFLFGVNYKF